MHMDPHPAQKHAGLQHAVWWPQQEVTRPKARFEPTSPEKSGLDGAHVGGGSNQVPTYLGQTSLFVFLPNMFPVFLNLQSHKVGRVSIKDFWFTVLPSLFCMAFCVFYLQLQAGPSVTPLLNQCSRLMFTVDGLWLLSCLGRSRPSVLIFCIKVATDVIKNGHNACTPKH